MNTIVWWLLQNSITVAVALPAVWLLARVRNHRPAEQHVLWLLLLIKLVTPPVVVWPVSVEELRSWMQTQAAVTAPGSDGEAVEVAGLFEGPVAEETIVAGAVTSPLAVSETLSFATRDEPPASAIGVEAISFEQAALAAWLIGAVILAAVMSRQIARHWWLMRHACGGSPELDRLVARVASRLDVPPVAVSVSPGLTSPCVSCLGRTRLLWPASLPDSGEGLEAVVAHELAHVRRRDHWVAWLELVATLAWWWNPLLWFIRFQLHETRELACDALSLELHSGDRRQYAELLLRLSQIVPNALSPVSPVRTGFGLVSRHSLRRRLKMVFQDRVSGRVSFGGIALAAIVASAALPSWAWSQTEPPQIPGAVPSSPVAAEPIQPPATPAPPKAEPAANSDPTPPASAEPKAAPPANVPAAKYPTAPKSAAGARSRLSRFYSQAADPNAVRSVLRLEDGDVIQEVPLGGEFKVKVRFRRLTDGTTVVEVEEDGHKAQAVVALDQPPAPQNVVSRTLKASKSADGKTVVWEDDTERRVIEAETGKVISVERKVKSEAKPALPGTQPQPQPSGFGSTSSGSKGTRTVTGTGALYGRSASSGGYPAAGATSPAPNVAQGLVPMTSSVSVPLPFPSSIPSPFDIELAEIKVQEKALELEAAREEAAATKSSATDRKVKLAELGLRRAEIELARLKGGGSSRPATTTSTPR